MTAVIAATAARPIAIAAPAGATRVAAPAPTGRPPRAPAIAQGRYAFAAFAGRPAAIKLAWPPVAGAAAALFPGDVRPALDRRLVMPPCDFELERK